MVMLPVLGQAISEMENAGGGRPSMSGTSVVALMMVDREVGAFVTETVMP